MENTTRDIYTTCIHIQGGIKGAPKGKAQGNYYCQGYAVTYNNSRWLLRESVITLAFRYHTRTNRNKQHADLYDWGIKRITAIPYSINVWSGHSLTKVEHTFLGDLIAHLEVLGIKSHLRQPHFYFQNKSAGK